MKVKEESEKVGLKLNIKIMACSPITSWQIDGETIERVRDFILGGGAPKSLQMVSVAMKLKDVCYDQCRQHIKKQRHYFANKDLSSQGYGFSSGHVWMWELDYKESWASKNLCFWIAVLKSPSDCKEIYPVYPKGNQSWIFIRRTDTEAETLITLATWYEERSYWIRPWCWERLKAGGEEDGRGSDGWMASPTQWTWVWASYGGWWWTGKSGVLQSMWLWRVGHDWVTELNWTKRELA